MQKLNRNRFLAILSAAFVPFCAVPLIAEAQGFYDPSGKCSPQKHASIPTLFDQPYDKARTELSSVGWQPVPNRERMRSDDYSPAEKWAIDAGYTELEACAGTGLAPCKFSYTDAYGNDFKVITEGEDAGVVTRFFFVCH